jgi:predicted O-methyltransferase YrrM
MVMPEESLPRSRQWEKYPAARYWWHRLPGMNFVPPIYADLAEEEWTILRKWYEETDQSGLVGECAVPFISFLHGLVMGNRAARIVQLGTCSGYSALLLGFMLRRMNVGRGLFSVDVDAQMCAASQRWVERAGVAPFVHVAQLDSTDSKTPQVASDFLGGDPELIIVDSSHEYRSTLAELDLWYPALAPGGLIVLHDVSRFAVDFDITKNGGVHQAFEQWRKQHPEVETFCLNGESQSMELPRPFYKDACGVGLIHKPGTPNE